MINVCELEVQSVHSHLGCQIPAVEQSTERRRLNREREKILHFIRFLALRARAARPSRSTATSASHMSALNSSKGRKPESLLWSEWFPRQEYIPSMCVPVWEDELRQKQSVLSVAIWAPPQNCLLCVYNVAPAPRLKYFTAQYFSMPIVLPAFILLCHCLGALCTLKRMLSSSCLKTATSLFMVFHSSTTLSGISHVSPRHLSIPQFHLISFFLPPLQIRITVSSQWLFFGFFVFFWNFAASVSLCSSSDCVHLLYTDLSLRAHDEIWQPGVFA